MVESPPANAGDTGSSPGLGGSHVPRGGWACEPQLLSLRVWSLCSAAGGAATVRGPRTAMKSGPRSPQLEKALAQKRRPNTAINKFLKKLKKKFSTFKNKILAFRFVRFLYCLSVFYLLDSYFYYSLSPTYFGLNLFFL